MSFRTDRNNNPTAFIMDMAKEAGLVEGTDYTQGDPFTVPGTHGPVTYYTARLLGDPIQLTVRVIDAVGYYTKWGGERWTYVAIPQFVWLALDPPTKKKVIAFHYKNEGGVTLAPLFA